MTNASNDRAIRVVLAVTLVVVALLSTISNIATPLFEPPDELQHYEFVRYLIDERRLPVQELDAEPSQSHQPPLYYEIAALLVAGLDDPHEIPPRNPFWGSYLPGQVSRDNKQQYLNPESQAFPYHGTALVVHVLRLWSTLLALGTVVGVWLLARALWPGRPRRVVAALVFSVLNPMFLFIAAAINNDNLVILCGAWMLYLSVRALRNDFAWGTTIFIGLVWSCALLTKITGLFLFVPWAIALVWVAWEKRSIKWFLSRLGVILLLFLGLTAWWFARNLRVYGELLALQRVLAVWGARETFSWAWLWNDLVYAWTTFWGRFAYGQVPLPRILYWLFLLITVGAAAGLGRLLVQRWRRRPQFTERWVAWGLLALTWAALVGALGYYIVKNPTGANGRYTFPALAAFSLLLVLGLSGWGPRLERVLLTSASAVMAVISVIAIGLFIPWTYARPAMLTESQALEQAVDSAGITFGSGIELVGTSFSPSVAAVGEEVAVTGCWRCLTAMPDDLVFYVHLLDHEFNSLGQRDTYTGLGTFPTSQWRPGDLFCETYRVPLTAETEQPVVANVELGFYDLDTRKHLPAASPDGATLDLVEVGQVKIVPSSPASIPDLEPLDARFEQGLALAGYRWSAAEIRGGDTVTLTVAWQPSGPLDTSYTVFTHLQETGGKLLAQDDNLPRDGAYPTTFWGAGETIVDQYHFTLAVDAPAGPSRLLIGLYVLEDGRRLAREAGSETPDWVELPGPWIMGR